MYVIETLPRAGTFMLYQFGTGKIHKAIIDSGIVMTHCGINKALPNLRRETFLPKADPNKDSFWLDQYFDHRGNPLFCGRCRR